MKKLGSIITGLLLACPFMASGTNRSTTTLYVGRHFEVREHDVPVKYVFNGSTRVARITGSLVVPSRIQRFRLYGGWNLVSLAISMTNALSQITEALPSVLTADRIYVWDGGTSSWRTLPDGQSLSAGTVLWLYAQNEAAFALVGTYTNPTNRTVSPSGGFLPSAGLESWDLGLALSNALSASAWSYDGSASAWSFWLPLQSPNYAEVIVAPGSAIFVRAAAGSEFEMPEAALRVCYYHQDHLGSSSVVSDAAGTVAVENAYCPFGATRNTFERGQTAEAYGFAQKEKDHETGLSYFEARYVMSAQAHFASVDPAYAALERLPDEKRSASLRQPQLLNLYSYALNSPLRFQDPTGLEVVKLNWIQTIAVVAAQQQAIAMLDDAIANVQRDVNACSAINPADPTLEKWFGFKNGLGNKKQIAGNLQKIRNQIARLGPENFRYDAVPTGDAAGAIAYVYPNDPNKVYLTDKFFALSNGGLDSKGGTLIHENSHPTAVLGTKDLAYGPEDAAGLATKDKGNSLRNADNYEYFNEGLQLEKEQRRVDEMARYLDDLQAGRCSK